MEKEVTIPEIGLAKADLRDLMALKPLRGYSAIALQWGIVAGAIAIAEMADWWPVTVCSIIVIATRQHALAVLMHDAAHYLISRNKRLNDIVSGIFLSLPILTSTSRYRRHHLLHHRYVNTEQDPDLENTVCPPGRFSLLKQLFADLIGFNTLTTLTTLSHFGVIGPLFKPAGAEGGIPAFEKRLALGLYAGIAVVLTLAGLWLEFLLYWLLPLVTVLAPILRFRALAEHGACPNNNLFNSARSVDAGSFERFMLAPCNVGLHLEHHLYPSVPHYNLPKLSAQLRSRDIYTTNAHRNDGYFVGDPSVFDEVTSVH